MSLTKENHSTISYTQKLAIIAIESGLVPDCMGAFNSFRVRVFTGLLRLSIRTIKRHFHFTVDDENENSGIRATRPSDLLSVTPKSDGIYGIINR